jgi:hypothetical protein
MRGALLALCLTALAGGPPALAADVGDGETIYIQLGDAFQADVGADGGVVYANFNAPFNTTVDVYVRAYGVSPDLTLYNADGQQIDLGGTLIEGLYFAEIDGFFIPADGNYTLAIDAGPLADGNDDGIHVNPGNLGPQKPADGQADGMVGGGKNLGGEPGLIDVTTGGKFDPNLSTAMLSGTVTNLWTADPIEGAEVTAGPYLLVTDDTGYYEDVLPVGMYDLLFEATYFYAMEDSVILFPDTPATRDAALEPVAPVVVEPMIMGDPTPGATIQAMANVVVLDGSQVLGYAWQQMEGVEAFIVDPMAQSTDVELGTRVDYKAEVLHLLAEPPIDADDLPPNVPPPPADFPGGLQDRFHVVGMNPWTLEHAALLELDVEVTTTSGVYGAAYEVHTHLPWDPTASIRTVPQGIPVILHGKDQASYDWQLIPPSFSDAELDDPFAQSPEFTPDWHGEYEVSVTDLATGDVISFTIYAGTWEGVIVGQDDDGLPIADPDCTGCHSNLTSGDKFEEWRDTGHANIFKDSLNSMPYYRTYCLPCHTVGYDTDVDNFGFDDQPDYQAFLDADLIGNPSPDNWATMLANYPQTARMGNIQCENCHGPQNENPGNTIDSHRQLEPRMTLSSDGCATCHGEPPRHGRHQQWQVSGHANYDLAIEESQSTTCAKCHTANGFLAWLDSDEPAYPDTPIEITWTEDEAHPMTCVACHDPHDVGTKSGDDTDADMRIMGTTPPLMAGFTAYGVGNGALCMTCHNSRRGLRNDDVFDDIYGTGDAGRAPHGPTQGDVMMGENAYYVMVGVRANHSFLSDSCVQCHMQSTPPPDDLSYNTGGTNHTFYAGKDICSDCHTGYDTDDIQQGVQDTLLILKDLYLDGINGLIDDQTAMGNTIDLNGDYQVTTPGEVVVVDFTTSRGRQAIVVELADGTELGTFRIPDITVFDADMVEIGDLYGVASPELVKAGWNYHLINYDGSLGIHNPTWTYMVLSDTISSLDMRAAPPLPDWFDETLLEQQQPEVEQPEKPLRRATPRRATGTIMMRP